MLYIIKLLVLLILFFRSFMSKSLIFLILILSLLFFHLTFITKFKIWIIILRWMSIFRWFFSQIYCLILFTFTFRRFITFWYLYLRSFNIFLMLNWIDLLNWKPICIILWIHKFDGYNGKIKWCLRHMFLFIH